METEIANLTVDDVECVSCQRKAQVHRYRDWWYGLPPGWLRLTNYDQDLSDPLACSPECAEMFGEGPSYQRRLESV